MVKVISRERMLRKRKIIFSVAWIEKNLRPKMVATMTMIKLAARITNISVGISILKTNLSAPIEMRRTIRVVLPTSRRAITSWGIETFFSMMNNIIILKYL